MEFVSLPQIMKTTLKIYNTISKQKDIFSPINPPYVGIYVCGPTLYSEQHIGNIRTILSFDIIYRYLKHLGYKVKYVRNITDCGHITNSEGDEVDRIGEAAKLEQMESLEIVYKYNLKFQEALRAFNILPPNVETAATAHIQEQIEMIEKIIDHGYAYVKNGAVYFDVMKYKEDFPYGEISGRKVDELLKETRDLNAQNEKKSFADFALWKKSNPEDLQKWRSPWGEGNPGWHIECTAMSTKYLGNKFDIHGGGSDLKFPHHENEVAQSCGAGYSNPANYWMHSGMLNVNGKKMSKSIGTTLYPFDIINGNNNILSKAYSAEVVRFFMIMGHYRSELDITDEGLQAAEKGFNRLMNAYNLLEKIEAKSNSSTPTDEKIEALTEKCYAEMNDDFNTPKTIAVLFDFASLINKVNDGKEQISKKGLQLLQKTMQDFVENILGLKTGTEANNDSLEKVMDLILDIRKNARNNKDYATSDKIRDGLKAAGIQINDGKDGASWSF